MSDITNLPAMTTPPRLPVPKDFDAGLWRVLSEAIWPNARTADSIILALNYCKVRGLDPLKKPVNIVSVWNSALGKYVEGFWPAINEVEVTASRSGEWAGMDEPKFGPMITEVFTGQTSKRGKIEATVTFPEWCSVTVYRMINGVRCPFTEPVWWAEAYGRIGGTKVPNEMWTKRPRGQLLKVAKAFSLRAAFPEEGDKTSDEIEGQIVEAAPPPAPAGPAPTDNWKPPLDRAGGGEDAPITGMKADGGGEPNMENVDQHQKAERETATTAQGDVVDAETGEIIEEAPHEVEHGDMEPWRDWCGRLMVFIRRETTLPLVDKWLEKNRKAVEQLAKDAPKVHAQLQAAVGKHRVKITTVQEGGDGEGRQDRAD